MLSPINRRSFLTRSAQVGAVAAVGDFAFLGALPSLSAQDVRVPRAMVQLNADIEPLVRLIEETDRDRLLERVAEEIRGGTSYQELLSALMLAGVRGIQPRPVGFKFHAVMVVNSAHLASQSASDRDRWLPLFWSLDNFKTSQARNRQEGNWVMAPVAEGELPAAHRARQSFTDAMDNWDEDATDRAVAVLARTAGAADVFELFWRYSIRDFRSIGHKIIFAAGAWRVLQTIGWRHAEPIVRSLAYALLFHEGTNPARRDADADRPWRENQRRLTRIRAEWQNGRTNGTAAGDLLASLRTCSPGEASDQIVTLLNREVSPASLWDGLFLMAGELLMRQPGIVGLHTLTTVNAMYFAYQASQSDETRKLVLLQTAAFLSMFRQEMVRRGTLRDDVRVDAIERRDVPAQIPAAVEQIFADVSRDKLAAARKTLAFLQQHPREGVKPLMDAARRLIFSRGTDSHDYKFSSAVLEDFFHTTNAWRDRFLAASMFWLKGSGGQDTGLYRRMRAALTNT